MSPVFRPAFKLILGKYGVKAILNVKTCLSRKLPCDTCEIELPLHKNFDLAEFRKDGLAVGTEMQLSLGYDNPEPLLVFTGVVTEVSPDQPLKIRCEDHAWALKQKRFVKTFSKKNKGPLGREETWYSEIAAYAIAQAGLTYQIPIRYDKSQGDTLRDSFVVNNQTCAQVLDELRKNGWDYWCLPGTNQIYFGPPWPWGQGILEQEHKYSFTFGYPGEFDPGRPPNIIKSDGLTFSPRNKVGKVVVYLTDSSFKQKAVKGEYGEGEPVKEFNFDESGDNLKALAAARAQQIYMQLNSNSYQGNFETIGHPFMTHSVEIDLYDPHHPERTGNYWVDQVEHSYGQDGFLTTVSLCEREEG